MRTRIKMCGITTPADAAAAVDAGADAVGVVLAESPRRVTLDEAVAVLADVPPLVARVGVFVDADPAFVREAVARLGLTAAQFHGDETPEACRAVGVPVIKAVRVRDPGSVRALTRFAGVAAAMLLDTHVPRIPGGTGRVFDWDAVARVLPRVAPIVLAGGLDAANVGEAIRVLRPFAVDVSSGIERSPGIKDPTRMAAFVTAVRAADEEV